ncbi:MAG: hypothetical protein ACLVCH_04190 [Roseburia inulinivorans]
MEYDLEELSGVDEEYISELRRTNKTTRADYETLEHSYKGDNYMDFLQGAFMGDLDGDTDEYDFYVRRLAEQYGFEYERQKR